MLRNKLHRISDQIGPAPNSEKKIIIPERYQKAADFLGGEIDSGAGGTFVRIINDFDADYMHGARRLVDLKGLSGFKKAYFSSGMVDSNEELRPDKMLFFDMETTGLGGSGTVAFLIGFGSVTDNGFQVRQYFLPDYPDEESMLEAVRSEIDEESIIVSYNGRAFDIPILVDRMIINRVERNLKFAEHIDLLHPVRRFYRRRLQRCNLTNVEQNILDFHRADDIPGQLVPAVYFNWLANDDTELLDRVQEHHLNDIISLYFLMHHLAEIQEAPVEKITEPDDILSMVKILEKKREHESISHILESLSDLVHHHNRHDILFLHSLAYKRCGRIEKALPIWEYICTGVSPEAFLSRIELAKYYEHTVRDFRRALEEALSAEVICSMPVWQLQAVRRRIRRLNRRIAGRAGK